MERVSTDDADPRCPECGGPIGQTATYCMHCSTDLTEERAAADVDGDGTWDQSARMETSRSPADGRSESLLDPTGVVDDTLTAVVGIAGGLVVGIVGTVVLAMVTQSGSAVGFGLVAWLGATAYLVRRPTVQRAVERTGYAVSLVLLLVPVVALSPLVSVDGGLGGRGGLFLMLLVFVALPAGIAAGIGWVASRFVSDRSSHVEG